jgi:hypothetical protein
MPILSPSASRIQASSCGFGRTTIVQLFQATLLSLTKSLMD